MAFQSLEDRLENDVGYLSNLHALLDQLMDLIVDISEISSDILGMRHVKLGALHGTLLEIINASLRAAVSPGH